MLIDDVERILRQAAQTWSRSEKDTVFEWLLRTEFTRMVRFGYAKLRRCGGELNDAEDAAGATIANLFRYAKTYTPERSPRERVGDWGQAAFRGWVYAALLNEVHSRRIKLLREREHFVPIAPDDEDRLTEDGADDRPWTAGGLGDPPVLVADYQELVGFLPRREAESIDLVLNLGYSHQAAAAAVGTTDGAMRVCYFTARHRLAAVHAWLDTLAPGDGRRLRLFVGMRLPLADAARRVGELPETARHRLAEGRKHLAVLEFARGRLLHREVDEWWATSLGPVEGV